MNKLFLLTSAMTFLAGAAFCQDYSFKELEQTYIKGAPCLTQPKLIKAGDSFMKVAKFGHAAPAYFDWDGDGKLDILVGEFGSGNKANVMVFKNIGTNKKPIYSSESFYAKDKEGNLLHIAGS